MDWKSHNWNILTYHVRLGAEQFNPQICPKHLNMTFLAKKTIIKRRKNPNILAFNFERFSFH